MIKVKVCGITNAEDARLAVELGAAMLGFNFYGRSPRYIGPQAAAPIIANLPTRVHAVGVFVNASLDEINATVAVSGIHAVQLHGDESAAFCRELQRRMPGMNVIKAYRTDASFTPEIAARYPANALLIDAACEDFGGSGLQANWEQAQKLAQLVSSVNLDFPRLILAGGLTPSNVAAAIRLVQPHAVDVCSGVESAKRRKDAFKLREFFAAVHSVSIDGSTNEQRRPGRPRPGGQPGAAAPTQDSSSSRF